MDQDGIQLREGGHMSAINQKTIRECALHSLEEAIDNMMVARGLALYNQRPTAAISEAIDAAKRAHQKLKEEA